jgi:hypothetical protein
MIPVLVVGLLALVVGAAVGWYLTARSDDPVTTTLPGASCTPATGSSPATSTKPAPKPSSITVDVYNSTTRQGLAGTTASQLEKRGFVIATVANDPLGKTLAGTAEIRYGPKGKSRAVVVAAQVPDSTLVNDKRKDKTVAMSLGKAFTGLATPEEAAAALSPSPSPTC